MASPRTTESSISMRMAAPGLTARDNARPRPRPEVLRTRAASRVGCSPRMVTTIDWSASKSGTTRNYRGVINYFDSTTEDEADSLLLIEIQPTTKGTWAAPGCELCAARPALVPALSSPKSNRHLERGTMNSCLQAEQKREFLQRGFSRRHFGRLASMLGAGAAALP